MPAPALAEDPYLGLDFGHYRILERIGGGGMGVVYRGRDEHLDREVAIKILSARSLGDEAGRKQFRTEALALSKLNHPNIVTIHDFDSREGVNFLVMEFIPGIALNERLGTHRLAEKEVIRLGMQLCEGLAAAHECGVVHRDLKPSNLRLTVRGDLKIVDFGLAKLRHSEQDNETTESRLDRWAVTGTLAYMAPEQVCGEDVDARADIHAAGLVLYEMATGHRLFSEVEISQLISAILHRLPAPIGTLNPTISAELGRIIAKCLEKKADCRYQTAKDLGMDLRRLGRISSDGSPAISREPKRMAGPSSLGRTRMMGAAIAMITVLAGGMGLFLHWRVNKPFQPASVQSVAVLPFADLSPNHDQEYFADGLTEEILNTLARIEGVRVVGRTSSFQFKGKNEDLRAIGQRLNVSNVLEGSVRKEGSHVRIAAQLAKTADGFQLWSETYDGTLGDVLGLQNRVATAVAAALQVNLGTEAARAMRRAAETTNPEAFQAFLQGRYYSRLYDPGSSRKAVDYFTRAIQLDPSYSHAYAHRAEMLLLEGGMLWMNYEEAAQKSKQDAERAVALAPSLPDGYRVMSKIQALDESNCPAAEQSLKKAWELAPTDPDTLAFGAMLAMCQGRLEEAVELTQQALVFDPLHPVELTHLGQHFRDLGRFEEAHTALQRTLDINPQPTSMAHETLGEVYLAEGRPQKALQEMQKEPAGWLHDMGLVLAYHALGDKRNSDKALLALISRHLGMDYPIARAYAHRGEAEAAFYWLERAYAHHDWGLLSLKTDVIWKPIRSDPRYTDLLRRMNLAP